MKKQLSLFLFLIYFISSLTAMSFTSSYKKNDDMFCRNTKTFNNSLINKEKINYSKDNNNKKGTQYGFSVDRDDDFFIDYPYIHIFTFGGSYIPYPNQGFDLDFDYNYVFKHLALGPGITYNAWDEEYTEEGEYSTYSYTQYFSNFAITLPLRFYIFPISDEGGFTLNLCAEPQLTFRHVEDWHKNIDETRIGYALEARVEAGYSIAGFFIKGFVGYNLNSFKKDFFLVGASCGASLF